MRQFLLFLSFALTVFAADSFPAAKPGDLEFARLDLIDGRSLRNVVVKSFNPNAQTLFVVADHKAMTISLQLVPPAVRPMFSAVRISAPTAAVSEMPRRKRPAPASTHGDPEPTSTDPAAAQPSAGAKEHAEFAQKYADEYYHTKHQFTMGSVSAVVIDVAVDDCSPMQGWERQYRSQGHVNVSYSNGQQGRLTFEVLSKEADDHSLTLVQFIRKS